MTSKFAEFLETHNLDPRRVLVASKQIERLRPEDRRIKLQKRSGKAGGEGAGGEEGEKKAPPKPRSGRPVTAQLLRKAREGKPIPGRSKTRLLRAVNRVLEQKQKDPVDLRALF